jgi:hypothetical protein
MNNFTVAIDEQNHTKTVVSQGGKCQQNRRLSLIELMSEQQWEPARRRLKRNPKEAAEEIQSIELYIGGSHGYVDTTGLPIHLACSMRPLPPTNFMELLINKHSEACMKPLFKPQLNILPIHLACDLTNITEEEPQPNHHGDIVKLLIQSYPQSILCREMTKNMLPLHIAASTAQTKNGVISPTAAAIIEMLVLAGPPDVATTYRDADGSIPLDYASSWCEYHQMLSVTQNQLHPLLRSVINTHLMTLEPVVRETEDEFIIMKDEYSSTKNTKRFLQRRRPSSTSTSKTSNKHIETKTMVQNAVQRLTANNVRERESVDGVVIDRANDEVRYGKDEESDVIEYNRSGIEPNRDNTVEAREDVASGDAMSFPPVTTITNTMICLKLRLSGLRTSGGGGGGGGGLRRGGGGKSSVPNPFFEVFVAHRGGISKGYYKSYPLYRTTEGTWEECFVGTGLTHDQLVQGSAHIGIRVSHFPRRGTTSQIIGTVQVSLEDLERVLGEGNHALEAAETSESGDLAKYPILQGYQVMGWVQVLSLHIQY